MSILKNTITLAVAFSIATFSAFSQKEPTVEFSVISEEVEEPTSNETLIEVIKDTKSDLELTLKYEILLKGKNKERPFQMIEYLFSEKGEMERESKILLKNTDHLVY